MYKQKLKHVLSEQHNTVSGLKIDGVSSSGLIRLQNAEKELGLRRETHGLQGDFGEKKLHNENCIKELKLVRLGTCLQLCFVYYYCGGSIPS